jgi:vitamin B12 transporter
VMLSRLYIGALSFHIFLPKALDAIIRAMINLICTFYNFIKRNIYWVLAVVILLLFIKSASAQTDSVKKLKEVKIKSKIADKATITPSQQLTGTDFKRYGALNVAEAAAVFSGVNVKDYGGIGGLKTISVRSLGANHTGVLYDGIQLNDAQNGQIDLGKFSLYNLKDIALYKGQSPNIVQPARSFASSSILAINTTRPQLSAAKPYQITAGIGSGSFGLVNPYLQWQQRLSSKWSFVLNSNYTGANGIYKFKVFGDGSDTLAVRHNSDIKAIQTDGALYWAKNDSNKFRLQFNYYNSDRGLPGPVIFYNTNSNQRIQNHDLLVQSAYEHIADNSFHLLVSSKFSQNYLHYTDPDFLNNAGGINENYTQHEFYQSAAAGYHVLPGLEFSYSSDVAVTNLFSNVYNYAFPTRVTLLNAVAADAVFGKWHLQGNMLHTYISESVQSGIAANTRAVFAPTAVVSVKPFTASNLSIRAFYKEVYRVPTFAEQYYYAIAPRSIRPELVKQFDLGATYVKNYDGLLHDISITADAYYNNVKDKIIYIPTRSPETPSVTNLGKVDIKGLDVTLKTTWNIATEWTGLLSANYTYQDAVDITDPALNYYLDQIPYTPKNLLNINAGFTHKQLSFYYNYMLSSSRYYVSDNKPEYFVPGYSISNISINYNFNTFKYPISASAAVNNLFNTNYVIVRSYPMPGRSYRLTMQITI